TTRPVPTVGHIERIDSFDSQWVEDRPVDVWLPPGYSAADDRRYPVIYAHDGQNLFDDDHAFAGTSWEIDRAVDRLASEEGIGPAIVVGIGNTRRRIPEYMPQRPVARFARPSVVERFVDTYGSVPLSDRYLTFIVRELKPRIDRAYRTLDDRRHTFLLGSSMGGLVSVYGICEFPTYFGGAACLSTSWTLPGRIMTRYLEYALPAPGTNRFYFDFGDEALIRRYEGFQNKVNRLLRSAGFESGVDWLTRRFPGDPHSESAWRSRVDVPLRFLLEPLSAKRPNVAKGGENATLYPASDE
ncbi:MAG: esterase, partial [Rhodothermales bacterium]|nr:esterase [Rhodothermales bacterium]